MLISVGRCGESVRWIEDAAEFRDCLAVAKENLRFLRRTFYFEEGAVCDIG